MNKNVLINIGNFIKRNYLALILLMVVAVSLELLCFNQDILFYNSNHLVEKDYQVKDGTLHDFKETDGVLTAETDDAHITFADIDTPVKAVLIQCSISNSESISEVYYHGEGETFSKEQSLQFSLDSPETVVRLPQTMEIDSLRLDLTNTQGDVLDCDGFSINPRLTYNFSIYRALVYLAALIALVLVDKFIKPADKEKFLVGADKYSLWVLVVLLVVIDLLYPVTVTYDSGHYLWLADIIHQGNWQDWDPVRYLGFPLSIFLSQSLFGYNQVALLIPMITAHIVLFAVSRQIVFEVFQPRDKRYKLLITLVIFGLIALDPTVVGYYHALLTEYVAATIAVISCYIAIKLYKAAPFSKVFYRYTACYFLLVPAAWHLKQPYISTAYFPFIIVCLLIILKKFTKKTVAYGVITNVILVALVLVSTAAWNSFLTAKGNPMYEDQQFSSFLNDRVSGQASILDNSTKSWVKNLVKSYLASANFVILDENGSIVSYSLTYSFQNRLIAQRMFNLTGTSNIFVYPKGSFDPYTAYLQTIYAPPEWINNGFQARSTPSDVQFTLSFLMLPVCVVVIFFLWIKKKNLINSVLLILGGTSLLNALAHMLASPIDRYFFLGYPLHLLTAVILIGYLISIIAFKKEW
ncbi:MAG: hypothetical protein WA110_05680 [Anaerolineaceae bacterium]